MKSLIYIVLVALLSGIIVPSFMKSNSNQGQVLTIQSVDESPNANLLSASCSIIENRLKDYGLKGFKLTESAAQNTIAISFTDKIDMNEILPLITSKGKTEFYETYNRSNVVKLLEKDDELFSLLNISSENTEINKSTAILGYCKVQNKSQVDSIIAKRYVSKPGQGIKYLWRRNNDGNCFLYLLKQPAAMDKSQILETVVVKQPNKNDNSDLMIGFNKNGMEAWRNLTKSNIGKTIAIALDNVVYCDPIVKEEIPNGKCIISGDFSTKEISYLKSLIGNDELPLVFKLIN